MAYIKSWVPTDSASLFLFPVIYDKQDARKWISKDFIRFSSDYKVLRSVPSDQTESREYRAPIKQLITAIN